MGATRTACVLVALAALTAGRSPAEPQQAPAVFGVDVRLVAVPVFVTDKDGRAVPELTLQDFEVEDGGRSVPIAGFLAVDAGAPRPLPGDDVSPRLVAASRRQFLLLFDQSFASPAGILKARKAALELLEKWPQPGDLVAAAKFGPGGVDVLVGFSPDRAQVARAVATMGSGGGARIRDPLGLAYDLGFAPRDPSAKWGLELADSNKNDPDFYRDMVLLLARSERTAYRDRVVSYVGELQRLAQLLDSVQGRKQVILLSGGFDQSVLTGAEGTEQADLSRAVVEGRLWEVQGDRRFGDAGARSTLDGLYEALARTDTVVHTVDVMGMAVGGALDETGSAPRGSGRGTLAEFAGRSGGRFIREGNDIAAGLREVLDASRHYYVLAFEPTETKKKPGELRKLKVKVKRPGLQVSHRAGYTIPDAKAATAATTQLQYAEVIAKGISGGALQLRAVAVPYRSPQGQVSLPVVLEIAGEALVVGAGGKAMPLEVYGYALDGEGRIQDALGLTPTLDLETLGPAIGSKGVQVLTAFRVREGPADLRFLVREPASGRSGSLRIASVVPSFEDGTLVLSPPLFMDDPRARLVIPTPSRANPDLQIPFRLEDTPFTPQAAPVLRNGEAREVCLMAYGGAAGSSASSTVKAALMRDDGQAIPLEVLATRVVMDADRFRRIVVSLTPKGVSPGDYRLRLALLGASGTEEGSSELAVRVD
jgi:VWFA-related protein